MKWVVFTSTLKVHFLNFLIICIFTSVLSLYFLASSSLIATVFTVNVLPPQFPSFNFISFMYFIFFSFPKERCLWEQRICCLFVSPVLDYRIIFKIKNLRMTQFLFFFIKVKKLELQKSCLSARPPVF